METQSKTTEALSSVAIRFAGDSGDGMQLTGTRFTEESARFGNDLATLPNFPAEIRAPAGSIPGVSSFQINFGSQEIYTAGDKPDVLVAMNPAALKANLSDLKTNGTIILNTDAFTKRNLEKAGYEISPLDDQELRTRYSVVEVPITELTLAAVDQFDLPKTSKERCKNLFALGIVSWMYGRSVEGTTEWLDKKFKKLPEVAEANKAALNGGIAFAQASELFARAYEVKAAEFSPGTYRNVTGNMALAYGLIAGAELSKTPLMYAGYPITPASDVLHELSRHKEFGALTFQAEDEIAACCVAIGSSYGGYLGVTASSGPGILLKQEAIGLATMAELPLVIVNVQRAGPSTGMPTKAEQADLFAAMFGRNGECPCAIVSASSPADAFDAAVEACRIALEHNVPVFLMSDGLIGNGSEPWKLPEVSELAEIKPQRFEGGGEYLPYARDPETLVRQLALPGTPGAEHRLGGIEKEDLTGFISYDPENHEKMVLFREQKIEKIADSLPELEVDGAKEGDLLVISWGSSLGSVRGAVRTLRQGGKELSHVHLRHLNPLPRDLEALCRNFSRVVVAELNSGQLAFVLRSKYLIDIQSISKVQGVPFAVGELVEQLGVM